LHSQVWRWLEVITIHWIGRVALLVVLTGCATTDGKSTGGRSSTLQLQPMPAYPTGEPQMPSSQQPRPPLTVVRPSVSAPSSTGGRVISVARLLSIPAVVLAVVLWPSELGDSTLRKDWSNTINPVTLEQWRSPEEFERFWQLPHQSESRGREELESVRARSSTHAGLTGGSAASSQSNMRQRNA
jgi:hypothetical protein